MTVTEFNQCAIESACAYELNDDGNNDVDWGDLPEKLHTSTDQLEKSYETLKNEVV